MLNCWTWSMPLTLWRLTMITTMDGFVHKRHCHLDNAYRLDVCSNKKEWHIHQKTITKTTWGCVWIWVYECVWKWMDEWNWPISADVYINELYFEFFFQQNLKVTQWLQFAPIVDCDSQKWMWNWKQTKLKFKFKLQTDTLKTLMYEFEQVN